MYCECLYALILHEEPVIHMKHVGEHARQRIIRYDWARACSRCGLGFALSAVSDSPNPRIIDAYTELFSAGFRLDLVTRLRVLVHPPPYRAPPCMVLFKYDSWDPPLRSIQALPLLSRGISGYPGLRLVYLLVLSDLGQDQMHGFAVSIWLSIDAAMMGSISQP